MLGGWLGAFQDGESKGQPGKLFTIDEVGEILQGVNPLNQVEDICADHAIIVPVNLKEQDAFHLTIEEYLHSLINLIEELV